MNTTFRRLLAFGFAFVIAASIAATPAFATKVVHRSLEDMSKISQRVFVGTCQEAVYETPVVNGVNMKCTRYTFQVVDPIKGELGETVTFRQFGKPSGTLRVPGMPTYREGDKYVLFLLPESHIGLTSPVGLMQGAFSVIQGEDGATVINGIDNRGLIDEVTRGGFGMNSTDLLQQESGPMDYHQFVRLVKRLVRQ